MGILAISLLFTLKVAPALERFTAAFSHSFSRPASCLTQGRSVRWNISQLSHGQEGICALPLPLTWIFCQKSPISLESCLILKHALYFSPITSPSPLGWEDETVKYTLMKASQNRHRGRSTKVMASMQANTDPHYCLEGEEKIFRRKTLMFSFFPHLYSAVVKCPSSLGSREAERQRTGGQGRVGVCAWIDPESRTTNENTA